MKKEGMFSRLKNWMKDYYKEISVNLKHDKTISNLSWGVIFAGMFTTFAFMLANPAGGAFLASAFITGVAFADMFTNTMQGNSSSYLMRGIMYAGMTLLAPVVAVAEFGLEKLQEHREMRRAEQGKGEILNKHFEYNKPVIEQSATVEHKNTIEYTSQKQAYEEVSVKDQTSTNEVETNDTDTTM